MTISERSPTSGNPGRPTREGRRCPRCGRAVPDARRIYCRGCSPQRRAWRVRIDQHLVEIERAIEGIRRTLRRDR